MFMRKKAHKDELRKAKSKLRGEIKENQGTIKNQDARISRLESDLQSKAEKDKVRELEQEIEELERAKLGELECDCEHCGEGTLIVLERPVKMPHKKDKNPELKRVHVDSLKTDCGLEAGCDGS